MKKKLLEELATEFLRANDYTWAGNDKTSKEFKTIIGNRIMEKERKVAGGMSSKKGGRINPKRGGRGGIVY